MFTNWASYAFIQLTERDGLEPEILCIRPVLKGTADLQLPGDFKAWRDTDSLVTLMRAIPEQTGLAVKGHQVRRMRFSGKGWLGKSDFRLRFYSILLTTEQFLDRTDVHDGTELVFTPISQAIEMKELIKPHGDLIRLAWQTKKT